MNEVFVQSLIIPIGKGGIAMVTFVALLLIFIFVNPLWAQPRDWMRMWSETISAAKKEGKVVVMGSADPAVRKELPEKFKARFGISLEYLGGRGGDNLARVTVERRARVHTVDAVMAGVTNMVDFYNQKFLEPLLPALILPEVLDPTKWKNGRFPFMDPEKNHVLRLYDYLDGVFPGFNTQHVKINEFRTMRELLNPKWSGKISAFDPTVSGTGQAEAIRIYLNFGEEFFKNLYINQKPAFSRDKRQIADWLGRGTYPISLSVEAEFVEEMKNQGLPVEKPLIPDAPVTLGAGNGVLALMREAPHPNAARVLVNWLASKEGLEILGRARLKPTTRNDIDESYALALEVPRPGVTYFDFHSWEFATETREKLNARIIQILRSR